VAGFSRTIEPDVLIVGGGIAGLWLLDALIERGYSAVLVESGGLGGGQTIASQGIIHGGVKYTLAGLFSASADAIAEMPVIWCDCLAGRRSPDLSTAPLRANHCHLWRTDDLASRLGSLGAQHALRVKPVRLDRSQRPEALRGCPGSVMRLDEQVIDPAAVAACFLARHRARIVAGDVLGDGGSIDVGEAGRVRAVILRHTDRDGGGDRGAELTIVARRVLLTAGAGNAALRVRIGLSEQAMQRRPLHMVMARGRLPELYGHCVDGAATRATITSARHSSGDMVWQIGGQIAEKEGVARSEAEQVAFARDELRAVVPGLDLSGVRMGTYRIDRAEARSADGARPNDAQCVVEGNTITAWPTKLALAPRLAERLVELLDPPRGGASEDVAVPEDWPRPPIAQPPWETTESWTAAE
jgi:glycerol-3-phosphate dehydrogenase